MSEVESKKLVDLRVVDLKAELEKRGLDRNGKKENLADRLSKSLIEEGKDPETYLFEPDKKPKTHADDDDKSEITEADSFGIRDKKDAAKVPEKPLEKNKVNEKVQEEEPTKKDSENDGHEIPLNLTLDDEETLHDDEADTTTDKLCNEDGNDDEANKLDASKSEDKEQKVKEKAPSGPDSKEDKDSSGATSSTGKNVTRRPKVPPASNPRVIWISNITKNTRASELKATLSTCGKVTGAKVVVNARYPGSFCFGYVTMATVEDAENVIAKLNNTELNGQMIKIEKFDNVRDEQIKQMRMGCRQGMDDKSSSITMAASLTSTPKRADSQSDSNHNQSSTKADGGSTSKENEKNDTKQRNEKQQQQRDRSSRNRSKERSRVGGGSVEPSRERRRSRGPRSSNGNTGGDVLTFDKIRAERERQRLREKERQLREDGRRRQQEAWRQREVEQRQRNEAQRLEREREKLKMEREKIEKEKAELIRMERERQRLEREKIKAEKIELERTIIRLSEDRRTTKRANPFSSSSTYEERKRPVADTHFKEAPPPPRYDAPSKISTYESKHESSSRSSNRDFHHIENRSHKQVMGRNTTTASGSSSVSKYDRSYENRSGERVRTLGRGKDNRYERDRSPHTLRSSNVRDRENKDRDRGDRRTIVSQKSSDSLTRSSGDSRYHDTNPGKSGSSSSARFERNVSSNWNSSHAHGTSSRSSSDIWQQKDGWRHSSGSGSHSHGHDENNRWNSAHQSNSSSMQTSCPPAPELVTYPVRYDFNKPMNSGMRKY